MLGVLQTLHVIIRGVPIDACRSSPAAASTKINDEAAARRTIARSRIAAPGVLAASVTDGSGRYEATSVTNACYVIKLDLSLIRPRGLGPPDSAAPDLAGPHQIGEDRKGL